MQTVIFLYVSAAWIPGRFPSGSGFLSVVGRASRAAAPEIVGRRAQREEGRAQGEGEQGGTVVARRVAHVVRVAPVVVHGDVPARTHLGRGLVEAFHVAPAAGGEFHERCPGASAARAVHGQDDGFGRRGCCQKCAVADVDA